jgi:MFS family permease
VSRLWCLFASSILFCISQLAGARISDPHHLIFVSGITGMAYGILFGVFPSIVSHTFGIDGLSQNWGIMTLAAIFGGYVFNLFYGFIYDRNSIVSDDGDRDCREGLACYSTAYIISFWAGVAAAVLTLWSIWHERQVASRRQAEKATHDRMV